MTVLLDLNVVLDALLGREPWRAEADAIWDANRAGQVDARMSAASLPTLFDLVRKQEDLARAHHGGNRTLDESSFDLVRGDDLVGGERADFNLA
jgi:PIN domain-containing protein